MGTMKRFGWAAAIPLALMAIGFAGCKPATTEETDGKSSSAGKAGSGTAASGDTIKIGIVASENGELRPWGIDSVRGAQLAVKEFNEAGGLNGKMVELIVGDSSSKAEQGKSAAEKLIGDGVIGLLGEVASGITQQIAISANEAGIPLVAIGATRPDITDVGEGIFRVCYTDDFQGPVMATFAFNELGLRRVAIITDKKQPYSTGLSNTFAAKFKELGGEIVTEQFYESGATQFGGQLTSVKAANPDGLFLSGYFNEVGPIVRQAREAGMSREAVPVLGGDGWDSSDILNSGGEAILGGFFCNHYNNAETRPEVVNFLAKWEAEYGGVPGTTMGALGYDAAAVMLDALKRAADTSSTALQTALTETEGFAAVSGTITFKGMGGNPPKRALVVTLTPEGQEFVKAYEPDEVK